MDERPPDPVFPTQPPLAPPPPPVPPGAIRPALPWEAPPPPAPPVRSRAGWIVAVALLVVAALTAGTVLALRAGDGEREAAADVEDEPERDRDPGGRGDVDETTTTTVPPTTATTAPATEEDLLAAIADIKEFIEQERGLPFLRDPVVELADDDAFEDRLLARFDEDTDDLVTTGRVLEAVGLVQPGTDLVAAMRALLGLGVVGFYDPETEALVVRGGSVSPYVRLVIAHELVHALEDQHFELHRPDLDESADERDFAFAGLFEGSARHIENRYRATFTPEEEAAAAVEELAGADDPRIFDIPLALLESIQMPYVLGPELVTAILDAGGTAALDAAFVTPPTTSEQLLEPDAFLTGDVPVPLAPPVADGEVIDEGVLGALGLAQLLGLGPLFNPGPPDPAITGWGGDAYVAWIDPSGRACLRATIVGDTPADTAELLDALDDWTDDPPLFAFDVNATVTGGDAGNPITLTSCAGA